MFYEEFPHTVTFQKKERVSDGMGGGTDEWVDVFTTEAHVQPITGRNRILAQQSQTPIDHKTFYPHQLGAKPGMRMIWLDRGINMSVKSDPIDQGGLGEQFMIECEEL